MWHALRIGGLQSQLYHVCLLVCAPYTLCGVTRLTIWTHYIPWMWFRWLFVGSCAFPRARYFVRMRFWGTLWSCRIADISSSAYGENKHKEFRSPVWQVLNSLVVYRNWKRDIWHLRCYNNFLFTVLYCFINIMSTRSHRPCSATDVVVRCAQFLGVISVGQWSSNKLLRVLQVTWFNEIIFVLCSIS